MTLAAPAAERAILGAVMLNPPTFDTLQGSGVGERWFADPANSLIWTAMTRCASKGIDIITLSSDLNDRGELGKVGGFPYLSGLSGAVPSIANVREYIGQVRTAFHRRHLVQRAESLAEAIRAGADLADVSALVDEVKVPETGAEDASEDLADIVEAFGHAAMAERAGTAPARRIKTHLSKLDHYLKIKPGHLVVVAGAPKSGKTMLALTMAKNVGSTTGLCWIVSCEMGPDDLGERIVSSYGVNVDNDATEGIAHAMRESARDIPRGAVRVDCTSLSLAAALQSCRVAVRTHGARMLFVDYLQLLKLPAGENRTIAVGAACSAFKRAAKALDVPIVLLSQLNRQYAGRTNQRPQPTDLRDSGQIEQDADAIVFVYRPAVCEEDADPTAYEVIISRQRNGPTGTANLRWRQGNGWICDELDEEPAPDLDHYGHRRTP